MKLQLDPSACDGFGFCIALVGELVTADEWGFPIVRGANVPPELETYARQAVKACPRKALQLVRNPAVGGRLT
ncbi:MAG: ferredoxin [Acidimicrobiales bacterium]|jgi:ferredoxin